MTGKNKKGHHTRIYKMSKHWSKVKKIKKRLLNYSYCNEIILDLKFTKSSKKKSLVVWYSAEFNKISY